MLQIEKHIIVISLIFLSISTWFYLQSSDRFSLPNYLTILLPLLLITSLMIVIVRFMGMAPKSGRVIIDHTTISVWPVGGKRRKVWISAALTQDDNMLIITTFGKQKSSVAICDVLSSHTAANALLLTLKSGEKWEVGNLNSLEVGQ